MSFLQGLAQGFQQSYQAAQENKRADKIAKLQAQLVEERLKQQQRQSKALAEVDAFMTPSPTSELGMESLSFSDIPTETEGLYELAPNRGMTLMEMLTDPDATSALIQSETLDADTILQEQRLRDQFESMNDMLGGSVGAPEGMIPTGSRYYPSVGRYLPEYGIDPNAPTPAQQASQVADLEQTLISVQGVTDAMPVLRGTLLEPGGGFNSNVRDLLAAARSFGEFGGNFLIRQAGLSPEEADQLLAAYDVAEKSVQGLAAIAASGGDAAQREAQRAAQAGLDKMGPANAKILSDTLKQALRRGELQGVPIPPELEAEIQATIEILDSMAFKPGKGKPEDGLPEGWTEEEWNALTPDEKARARELMGG